jgi:hypothetical protein
MTGTNRLRIEEVALFLGVSVETINIWYRYKKQNPNDEYAKMLPDFEQDNGAKSCRWWKQEDLDKLLKFKEVRPMGRNGAMGTVTQKYVKKKEA